MDKKPKFTEKISYYFDSLMSKGTIALVGMLFLITFIVVVFTGSLGSLCNGKLTTGNSIWQSLMHAIDAGTLAGDDTSNIPFIILMTIVTICGIFVTSILIGIISTGFEEKLNSLRKGLSRILETNHTVIIGFDENIYTILTELIEANSNHKKACIVILDEIDKEIMDEQIQSHISDYKTTKIICRSGNCTNQYLFKLASLEVARSIIVNKSSDFEVIKILLALTSYLKEINAFQNDAHITAVIHNKENLDAAVIAGEGKAEVIFFKDILARIIAQVCRQPGLSFVLSDFFGYGGAEFYYENFPELSGKTFADVLNLFESSVVVGIKRKDDTLLNPPMDTVLESSDLIIHLAEDDGVSKPAISAPQLPDLKNIMIQEPVIVEEPYRILVLGQNASLPSILTELDEFVVDGSSVTIASTEIDDEMFSDLSLQHLSITTYSCNIFEKSILTELTDDGISNILLLCSDDIELEKADAQTMLILLQLRNISSKTNRIFNITSEMNSVENQKLSQVAKVNDFVVGSSITNLVLTQISENRALSVLFSEMLDSEGSEIYMKPAEQYVKLGTCVDFYILTEIAKSRRELVVGCKQFLNGETSIIVNPPKSTSVTFQKEDALIVIALD